MKINETIRKYRKEQNLTQEQLANFLGVTAPAVNKWENAITYPDITLLAPLARILKIDLNTLLSFGCDDLTNYEINQIVVELSGSMSTLGYDECFKKGENLILTYPNCNQLILSIVQILNAYLSLLGVTDQHPYQKKIIRWLELLIESGDKVIADQATSSLSMLYMEKEEFEKAQELLDSIQTSQFDKNITQALLYMKQDQDEKAKEVYESNIHQLANKIFSYLLSIMQVYCSEGNYEEAKKYAILCQDFSHLFELGAYNEYAGHMLLATEQKDADLALSCMEKMFTNLEFMKVQRDSSIYKHIKTKQDTNIDLTKKMFLQAFETDHSIDFLRDDIRFQNICNLLK